MMPLRILATGLIALLTLLFVVSPARAADPGILVVDPPVGNLATDITLSTAGVCQQGVGFIVAVRGDGIDPEQTGNLVGMTSLDSLPAVPEGVHSVALSTNLGEYFLGSAGTLPKGNYDLVFGCRNQLDTELLQTFVATIRIDQEANYEVRGDSARALAEVLDEIGFIPPAPQPGDDEVIQPPSDVVETPMEAIQAEPTTSTDDSLRGTLLIVGAILLVGAMSAWFVMSRREKRSKGSERRDAEVDA